MYLLTYRSLLILCVKCIHCRQVGQNPGRMDPASPRSSPSHAASAYPLDTLHASIQRRCPIDTHRSLFNVTRQQLLLGTTTTATARSNSLYPLGYHQQDPSACHVELRRNHTGQQSLFGAVSRSDQSDRQPIS